MCSRFSFVCKMEILCESNLRTRTLSLICWLIVLFALGLIDEVRSSGYLSVTQNGPTVLGSTITFNATYVGNGIDEYVEFIYAEEFHSKGQTTLELKNTNTIEVNITFSGKDNKNGIYKFVVDYYKYMSFFYYFVAHKQIQFQVTDTLNMELTLKSKSNRTIESKFVSSSEPTLHEISILSEADHRFVKNAQNVTVKWYVNCNLTYQGSNFSIEHNYTKTDTKYVLDVIIEVVAAEPLSNVTVNLSNCVSPNDTNPQHRYAHFQKEIIPKDPISNISLNWNGWLSQGNALDSRLYCNGSSHFYYCITYYDHFINTTTNQTCDYYLKSDVCSIPINWYYYTPGKFTVFVFIKNQVSSILHNITVNVYEIEKQAQLSVVIVPIFFTLISIVMVIFGIAYFLQRRREFRLITEEANFDFSHRDFEYQTFGERLKTDFVNALPNQFRQYLFPDDRNPLVSD